MSEQRKTEVRSEVTAVTVFRGRAMVTRHASVDLEAGSHVLIFPGLPPGIERESIQVKGAGDAVLGQCVFDTEYLSTDMSERRRSLDTERLALSDALEELELSIASLENEKAFLEKVARFVTTPRTGAAGVTGAATSAATGGSGTAGPAGAHGTGGGAGAATGGSAGPDATAEADLYRPAAWTGFLSFFRENTARIDRDALTLRRRVRDLQRDIERVDAQIGALGTGEQHSRDIIRVGVETASAGKLEIDLSCMVYGPDWRPVYDIRAESGAGHLVLEYNALVRQATGEDWKGVDLKLSTARVNVSGVLPELTPRRLRLHVPFAPGRSSRGGESEKRAKSLVADGLAMSASMAAEESAMYSMQDEDEVFAMKEIGVTEARVDEGGAAVVFGVAGGGDIGGDNTDIRVTLMRRELPAEYRHSAVPRLAEFAYLTAKITNDTEFPMLPGDAGVFFDGSFVATTELPLLMPAQETDISLGVDEGIKVEYRCLRRFRRNEGRINKRITEQFDYKILIVNHRAGPVSLKVLDQFPVSEDREILVKKLAPLEKDTRDGLTIDEEDKIEWNLNLPPAGTAELPLSFLVEYPLGRTILLA